MRPYSCLANVNNNYCPLHIGEVEIELHVLARCDVTIRLWLHVIQIDNIPFFTPMEFFRAILFDHKAFPLMDDATTRHIGSSCIHNYK